MTFQNGRKVETRHENIVTHVAAILDGLRGTQIGRNGEI